MSGGDPIQAWLPVLPLVVNRALPEIGGQR
jgi:hypothetical protein